MSDLLGRVFSWFRRNWGPETQEPILRAYRGRYPKIGKGCYLAPGCSIVGDVTLGENCSVWFGAVIRGDGGPIKLGDGCNIQDGVVVHCLKGGQVTLNNRVSVGHNATLHGCTIEDDVLIGVGAIVMDDSLIKSETIIGAGALVSSGKQCGPGLYVGIPAKKCSVKNESVSNMIEEDLVRVTAERYLEYSEQYRKGGWSNA